MSYEYETHSDALELGPAIRGLAVEARAAIVSGCAGEARRVLEEIARVRDGAELQPTSPLVRWLGNLEAEVRRVARMSTSVLC